MANGELLTTLSYVALVVLWSTVLGLYVVRLRESRAQRDPIVASLIVVLVVDAFKNIVESVYFGTLWSTRFGFLPASFGEPLENPTVMALPKLLNVGVAVFIIVRVIGGVLPRGLDDRRRRNEEQQRLNDDLENSLVLVRESERRLQSLLERTSDVVVFWCVIDDDIILESVNKAGKAMLGFGDEAIGTSSRSLAPRPLQELLERALITGQAQREEEGWLDTPGGRRAVIRQVVPLPDKDGVVRHIASFTQDITALRERQADEEGRARLESLGILAGGVAHDFNNLLTILRADLDLAREASANDARAEAMAHADVTIDRTRDLVTQLLAMAGKRAPVTGAVDFGAVVEDTARLLLPGVPAGVRLTTTVTKGAIVVGDRTQLQQVVLNLMKNGLDAVTSSDGRHVDAVLQADEREVVLVVKDDGPGIDPAAQWRIFEPFFTTKRGGRGLGLATVFGLTRAHGGTVEVGSTPGEGATFTVRLPRALGVTAPDGPTPLPLVSQTASSGASPPGAAPASSSTGAPSSTAVAPTDPRRSDEPLTILLVDDDERVRRATRRLLERLGHTVLAAASGAEAIGLTGHFDIAVVDVTMPEMDGPTTLARLREQRPALPGILVTGRGDVAGDGDVVLPKPFDEDALGRALREVMQAADDRARRS